MAIEAEPGFQPQRVAGAEADQRHFRRLKQAAGEGFGHLGGQRNLIAVLAGVAGARNLQLLGRLDAHERQFVEARREARQHAGRQRALQRQQRALGAWR